MREGLTMKESQGAKRDMEGQSVREMVVLLCIYRGEEVGAKKRCRYTGRHREWAKGADWLREGAREAQMHRGAHRHRGTYTNSQSDLTE